MSATQAARSGETLHGQPAKAVFELDEWLSQLIWSKPPERRNLKTLSACRSYQVFQPKESVAPVKTTCVSNWPCIVTRPLTKAVLTRHYLRKKAG